MHIVCKTTQTSELEHGKTVISPKTLTAKPLKYIPPNNNDKSDKLVKSVPTMNPQNDSALSRMSKSTQSNTLKQSESVAMHKNTTTRKGEDRILNYGMQVIQLGIFLLQLMIQSGKAMESI